MTRASRPRWKKSGRRAPTRRRGLCSSGLRPEVLPEPGLAKTKWPASPSRGELHLRAGRMFSLKDKIALVTGASQGIGRETAVALAEAGAKVAVAARNEEKLAALVKDITAAGGAAFAVKMDVAEAEQIKAGFKAVLERFGRLDILVNNAAITRDGLALRMKQEDWDAVIRTNLTGAHLCIQQAMSTMMRARAGRIINITSVVAQTGNAG